MKKIALLSMAIMTQGFAQDISHTLNYYGDTISKSLIKNGHIQSKDDTLSIERVLKLNNLTWSTAKTLPVGQLYYVNRESVGVGLAKKSPARKSIVRDTENRIVRQIITKKTHSFDVEFGSFYHTQNFNNANIFSDLSQYANFEYDYEKRYYGNAAIKRFVYSEDNDQNITRDNEHYTYDISAGKMFNTNVATFSVGAYSKTALNFALSNLNEVGIEKAQSNGVHAAVESTLYRGETLTWFGGVDLKKNLTSNDLDDYVAGLTKLGTSFKYDKSTLSVVARYGFSSVDIDKKDITEQIASLGLNTSF